MWLIDWLICRNPQARWCALGPSLSMSIVVKNVWLIDGWIVIIKCVVWLINWLYVYLGKIVCTGAKTEHVHCCENVLNVIDYCITLFRWSLAIQNLIRHFLIWSYYQICWICFFSFYFYKFFWTYLIFSFCS